MRVSDYIAERLHKEGIRHVYGLVGGGCAGLNDGFFCNPGIEFVAFHHEQGAGHAAVGSARTNRKLSVANVTTGCGGTNALTSCLNAWQESVPVLFLSGNTRLNNIAAYINKQRGINLRRYGIQEHDIVGTVKNMTKYAVLIEDVKDVAYELDKAIHIATTGRPGPVWIDVPGNIQTAQMPENPRQFVPEADLATVPKELMLDTLKNIIYNANRPVVIAGAGIGISNSQSMFRAFIEHYQIPFVTNFLTRDLIAYEHPQNIGMWGIKGNRAANFAVQNSDCLIILGSSMNVTHIGYDEKSFSPHSVKIMIDIDSNELKKDIFKVDVPIVGNVSDFLHLALNNPADSWNLTEWTKKCLHWKSKWPIYDPVVHRPDVGGLNLYEIIESMNRHMKSTDLVIADAGQPCYICSTNLRFKEGQRYMVQAAQGDMGYAVPALVGVNKVAPEYNIIACIGEGSFYTNMQELAVIRQHNIPAKLFVINNDGYMSIKQTQTKFFQGRLNGVSGSTGVYFADIAKVAASFEIEYVKISNNKELDAQMGRVMHYNKPIIVEFMSQDILDVLPAQAIKPDGTQGGLHEMAPFLSQEELDAEMIVKI
jgi:acetolactate synthase-1/2/3 large subunit